MKKISIRNKIFSNIKNNKKVSYPKQFLNKKNINKSALLASLIEEYKKIMIKTNNFIKKVLDLMLFLIHKTIL
jgi:hypothetical protein